MATLKKNFIEWNDEFVSTRYRFQHEDIGGKRIYCLINDTSVSNSFQLKLYDTPILQHAWGGFDTTIECLNPILDLFETKYPDKKEYLYEYLLRSIRYTIPQGCQAKRKIESDKQYINYYNGLITDVYNIFECNHMIANLPFLYCGLLKLKEHNEYPTTFVTDFLWSNFIEAVEKWDFSKRDSVYNIYEDRDEENYSSTWIREVLPILIDEIRLLHKQYMSNNIIPVSDINTAPLYDQVNFCVSIPKMKEGVKI